MILQERLIVLAVVFTMALGVSLTLTPGVLLPYGLALGILACAAVPYLLHGLPAYRFSMLHLIVPVTIAVAAPSVAHDLSFGPLRLLGVFGPGALLYGTLLAEALSIAPEDENRLQAAKVALSLASYAAALAVYLLLYQVKERTLLSAPAAGAASAALALRVFGLDRRPDLKMVGYALVVGLSLAELVWPLNYWVLGIVAGGLALLLAFYVLVGLLRQLLAGEISQAVVVEWGTVSLAGLAVVFGASRL